MASSVEPLVVSWDERMDALLGNASVKDESQVCVACHRQVSPKMVEQWAK